MQERVSWVAETMLDEKSSDDSTAVCLVALKVKWETSQWLLLSRKKLHEARYTW